MRVGGQGLGLSYANFTFGKPAISAASASAVDTVHITIPVTNTATRDGRTVVQLYSEAPIVYGLGHFQRTLVGFAKVFVAGGSTATATIALKVKDLGRWSPQAKAYVVAAGHYTLHTQGCAGTLWDGWLQGTDGEPFDGALLLPLVRFAFGNTPVWRRQEWGQCPREQVGLSNCARATAARRHVVPGCVRLR